MSRLLVLALPCGAVLLVLLALAGAAGLRLNTSRSIPLGVYYLSSRPAERGDYVAVCPPRSRLFDDARARGYLSPGGCPDGQGLLLKVLAATAGAQTRIDARGVWVGGELWPASAPRKTAAGRALPAPAALPPVVPDGSAIFMSERCELGFDARYFGLLPAAAIVATAVPIMTW